MKLLILILEAVCHNEICLNRIEIIHFYIQIHPFQFNSIQFNQFIYNITHKITCIKSTINTQTTKLNYI